MRAKAAIPGAICALSVTLCLRVALALSHAVLARDVNGHIDCRCRATPGRHEGAATAPVPAARFANARARRRAGQLRIGKDFTFAPAGEVNRGRGADISFGKESFVIYTKEM